MEAFILVIQLHASGPIVRFPVADCSEAVAWIREARKWAVRSGVDPVAGPMYACSPAANPLMWRVSQ